MAYERINWQNEPSEATALNDVNLNKMDSAIYDHDQRLDTDEASLANKVDKVNGKGLSQVDNVTVTQHVAYGTVVSTIKTYKQDGTEVTSQVCNGVVVDSALSDSSTNPVQNKVVKSALDDKVDKESGKGLSEVKSLTVTKLTDVGTDVAQVYYLDQSDTPHATYIKNGITVDSALSSSSTNPVQNKVVKSAIDGKSTVAISDTLADGDTIANVTIDGETTPIKASKSEEMNVRSAMMLLTPPISNNAPHVKRVVGGGIANPYLCKLNKIIGASVVWNQLVYDGNFDSLAHWSSNGNISLDNHIVTVNQTRQYGGLITGSKIQFAPQHIILIKFSLKSYSAQELQIGYGDNVNFTNTKAFSVGTSWDNYYYLHKIPNTVSTLADRIFVRSALSSDWIEYYVAKAQYFDITQMFGSTIADYVYTLETQTAGSGIAWLKSYGFFTDDYYAYSANTLQSVSVSGKKNVGNNQLDLADISGTETSAYYHNISTDYKLKANVTYTLSFDVQTSVSPFNMSVGVGTESGSYSADVAVKNNNSNGRVFITFTPTQEQLSQYEYLKIRLPRYASQTTFTYSIKDIQLELSSTATAYEPYTETTYPLDHTTLRGLLKLDANNNLYADGDVYPSDGSGDKKYAEVDLGDLNWTKDTTSLSVTVFRAFISDRKAGTSTFICSKYPTLTNGRNGLNDTDKAIASWNIIDSQIVGIRDDSYSSGTEEQFKTAMDGVKLVYEKATASALSLTPYQSLQNIESGGTEEFIDYGVSQGTRDVAIPCGQESEYNSGVAVPNLPTSGGKVELTYNPANGQFTWE